MIIINCAFLHNGDKLERCDQYSEKGCYCPVTIDSGGLVTFSW